MLAHDLDRVDHADVDAAEIGDELSASCRVSPAASFTRREARFTFVA